LHDAEFARGRQQRSAQFNCQWKLIVGTGNGPSTSSAQLADSGALIGAIELMETKSNLAVEEADQQPTER
jgi:hypothetical protein